ncbi:MAG: cold shock domain-containing protein [Chitinispirillales bacterium]|jgi:CspA family cold shock protein|nr:cold shock domain-containing protein [Chitinispirillales bacterium]
MATGTVLWFNDISGTGKIRGDDGSYVIVSQKSLQRDGYKILDEGQRVSYEAVMGKSGLEARSVYQGNLL